MAQEPTKPGSSSETGKPPDRRTDEADRRRVLKKASVRPIGQPEEAREETPIGWDFGPDGPPLDRPEETPGGHINGAEDEKAGEDTSATPVAAALEHGAGTVGSLVERENAEAELPIAGGVSSDAHISRSGQAIGSGGLISPQTISAIQLPHPGGSSGEPETSHGKTGGGGGGGESDRPEVFPDTDLGPDNSDGAGSRDGEGDGGIGDGGVGAGPPAISGVATGDVQEDAIISVSGQLIASGSGGISWSTVSPRSDPYGSFILGDDGTWFYELDNDKAQGLRAGEAVQEIFTIKVTDAAGASVTQIVTVTVTGTNDAPVISGTATGMVQEDEALTVSGALTSTDADIGDSASWMVVGSSTGQYGSLTLGDDGAWSYTLDNDTAQGLRASETAQEIFTVKVTDAEGASDTQTVTVKITGTNDAPIISGTATGIVQEDGTLTTRGTLGVTDADIGDTADWSVVGASAGQYGSFTLGDDGHWSYVLDNDAAQGLRAGETAQEIFTVKVSDTEGASDIQTITVTVTGTNDAPVISGTATGAVQEDEALTASGTLTAADADIGDTANWLVIGSNEGRYGSFTLGDDGAWSYTLDNEAAQGLRAGETAQEIFTVKVSDAEGASDTQTITVMVTGTNDAPVISGTETGAVQEDEVLTASGRLTAIDSDIGDSANWSVIGNAEGAHGAFTLNPDGSWSYTLNNDAAQALGAGESAQESFTVRVTDAEGASADQTITIIVNGTNDVPVISGTETGAVREDEVLTASGLLTAADADVDDVAAWSLIGGGEGAYGNLVIDENGAWSYTLDNDAAQGLRAGETAQEIFTVKVSDAEGASDIQTITVTVTGTNDAPVISDVATGSVREDETLAVSGQLTSTDADVGDTAAWSVVGSSSGAYGALALSDDGTWSYALDNDAAQGLRAGETAQEIFTVKVTDAAGASDTQTVTVKITGTNDAPIISGTATGAVQEDEALTASGTLIASDADIGDTAAWSVVGASAGQYGSFTLGDDGHWSYVLDNDAAQGLKASDIANEIFTVRVTDAVGATTEQTVTVTISGTNDIPVISGTTTGIVQEDESPAVSGILTSSDADVGDTAAWSVIGASAGQYGSFTLGDDGHWSYALDNDAAQGLKAGETAQEIFTVKVTDAEGASDTQTITVIVAGTNDAPVISGTATGFVEEDGILTAGGTLDVFDADTGDTATWSVVGGDAGNYGSLSIDENGRWSYSLDNDKAQGLRAGETAQETFTVRVTDSDGANAEQTITVTVSGTNDVPVISGTSTGQVQEDAILTATGTLTAFDADRGDSATWSIDGAAVSDHGIFAVDPNSGQWTYTLDNDTAQGMKAGDVVRETFTVRATDSAGASETHLVSVEITGTNDGPQVGQALNNMGSMKEDTSLTFSAEDLLRGAQVTDIDHDSLTITTVGLNGSGAPGTLVDNGNGTWTFTPNQNVSNVNAEIAFQISDGHTSVSAQASVAIQPVADPAAVSISSSALQEVIKTGPANDLGRIVAPQITTRPLSEFTLEFTVVGNSVPESTTGAGPVIVNIGSPPSDKNALTLWDPANMKVGMSKPGGGDINIATGINLTDGESHRVTVTWDAQSNTLKVYNNGDLALTTQLAKPLPSTLYMAVAEKANTPPTAGSPSGGGYRPNEHFEGTIFNVAMSNKAETAEQVKDAPLAEQMENNLLIDLRAQNDRIVDTTGRNAIKTGGSIDTDALSVDTTLGSAPVGSVVHLDIDTQLGDPNDHISSLVVSGFLAGTVVSDGVHSVAVTGPNQKIDITDWSLDKLTADLPDGVRTSMDLKVTATTTTPAYETGALDAQGQPVTETNSATSDEHHILLVEGGGPPPVITADDDGTIVAPPADEQSDGGDIVVIPGELTDGAGGTSEETPQGGQPPAKPGTATDGGSTTTSGESSTSKADGSDTVPSAGDAGTASDGTTGAGPTNGQDEAGTVVVPGTELPISAGSSDTTGEASTGTSEPPASGTQADGSDTTAGPTGGTGSSGDGTVTGPQPPVSAGGSDTPATSDTTDTPATGGATGGTIDAPSTGTGTNVPTAGGETTGPTGTSPGDGGGLPEPPIHAGAGDDVPTIGGGTDIPATGSGGEPPAAGAGTSSETTGGGSGTTTGSTGGTPIGDGTATGTQPPVSAGGSDTPATGDTTGAHGTGGATGGTIDTPSTGAGTDVPTTDVGTTGPTGTGLADGGGLSEPPIHAGAGGDAPTIGGGTDIPAAGSGGEPPATGGGTPGETMGDGSGTMAPPVPAEPVDASGHISFVSVNDWYNPSWGGGYNATFQLTLTDEMLHHGSLEGWSLEIGINDPNAVVSTGWLDGFNGTVSFDPATGVFTNAGQDYQPELHAGDVIQFSIQVQNTGFDRNDISFSFKDLDPPPEGAADSGGITSVTATPDGSHVPTETGDALAVSTAAVQAWGVATDGDQHAATHAPDQGQTAPDAHTNDPSATGAHAAESHADTAATSDGGAASVSDSHDSGLAQAVTHEPTSPELTPSAPLEDNHGIAASSPSTADAYLELVQPPADDHTSTSLPADEPSSGAAEYVHMAATAVPTLQEPPPPDHLFADVQVDHAPASGASSPDMQPDTHHDVAAAAAAAEPILTENDQSHLGH